jgi:hypothetical protein
MITGAAWALAAIVLLVCGGLTFYALYSKGDVRAEFSLGSTLFKIEAKDRRKIR